MSAFSDMHTVQCMIQHNVIEIICTTKTFYNQNNRLPDLHAVNKIESSVVVKSVFCTVFIHKNILGLSSIFIPILFTSEVLCMAHHLPSKLN